LTGISEEDELSQPVCARVRRARLRRSVEREEDGGRPEGTRRREACGDAAAVSSAG